jgi:hypothetical protein
MCNDTDWLSDVQEELQHLEEIRGQVDHLVERVRSVVHVGRSYADMNSAYADWRRDPEDIARGVVFAHCAAEFLNAVPSALPGLPDEDVLRPVLARVVAIADTLGGLLLKQIVRIDATASRSAGDIRLWEGDGPVCSGGSIDDRGVSIIRALPLSKSEKEALFRRACHAGLADVLGPELSTLPTS